MGGFAWASVAQYCLDCIALRSCSNMMLPSQLLTHFVKYFSNSERAVVCDIKHKALRSRRPCLHAWDADSAASHAGIVVAW